MRHRSPGARIAELGCDLGERPQDEFIPGTARNVVSRVLADTDGDGYTDSFWFLSPIRSTTAAEDARSRFFSRKSWTSRRKASYLGL